MAKALKAPGQNGSATVADLVADLVGRTASTSSADYFAEATRPVARLLGDRAARDLIPHTAEYPNRAPRCLARIAHGLALRGDHDDARRALDDARAAMHIADGEAGALAWCDLARALHAHGDTAEVDTALDAAVACAAREVAHPSQPIPHLARVFRELHRVDRFTALLTGLSAGALSSEVEAEGAAILERAVADGDHATLRSFGPKLMAARGDTVTNEMFEAGARAARAGRADGLLTLMEVFDRGVYTPHVVTELARAAAEGGRGEVARALMDRWYPRDDKNASGAAQVYAALGEPERVRAAIDASDKRRGTAAELAVAAASLGQVDEALGYLALCLTRVDFAGCVVRAVRAVPPEDSTAANDLTTRGLALASRASEATASAEVLAALGLWRGDLATCLEAVATAAAIKGPKGRWARNQGLVQLGQRFADAEVWEAAFAAMKKCTHKGFKGMIASRIANLYARRGDLAGARAAIATIPAGELKGVMALVDALAVLAGEPPPYANTA